MASLSREFQIVASSQNHRYFFAEYVTRHFNKLIKTHQYSCYSVHFSGCEIHYRAIYRAHGVIRFGCFRHKINKNRHVKRFAIPSAKRLNLLFSFYQTVYHHYSSMIIHSVCAWWPLFLRIDRLSDGWGRHLKLLWWMAHSTIDNHPLCYFTVFSNCVLSSAPYFKHLSTKLR